MHLLLLVLMASSMHAFAAEAPCAPVRVGYTDQTRPPFFLGAGAVVPEPAGMGVELIRRTFKALNCTLILKRLPPPRLLLALNTGDIDFSMIGMSEELAQTIAFPTLDNGAIDRARALHIKGVVYVRMRDGGAAADSPQRFFKSHTLAAHRELKVYGGTITRGLKLDYGAADVWANLEKLRFGRVDGAMAGLFDETSLDDLILVRYGDDIVRLREPLILIDITLAANKNFYRENPLLVRRTWDRIWNNWPSELAEMMKTVPRVADDRELLDQLEWASRAAFGAPILPV